MLPRKPIHSDALRFEYAFTPREQMWPGRLLHCVAGFMHGASRASKCCHRLLGMYSYPLTPVSKCGWCSLQRCAFSFMHGRHA